MSDDTKIPQSMLMDWIVEDLTNLYSIFDDNRYHIFRDFEKLDHIADNIKSLKNWYGKGLK